MNPTAVKIEYLRIDSDRGKRKNWNWIQVENIYEGYPTKTKDVNLNFILDTSRD